MASYKLVEFTSIVTRKMWFDGHPILFNILWETEKYKYDKIKYKYDKIYNMIKKWELNSILFSVYVPK